MDVSGRPSDGMRLASILCDACHSLAKALVTDMIANAGLQNKSRSSVIHCGRKQAIWDVYIFYKACGSRGSSPELTRSYFWCFIILHFTQRLFMAGRLFGHASQLPAASCQLTSPSPSSLSFLYFPLYSFFCFCHFLSRAARCTVDDQVKAQVVTPCTDHPPHAVASHVPHMLYGQ